MADIIKSEYWNNFYASSEVGKLDIPSQFAVFVAQEIRGIGRLVDIGCGTGRDSIFFASRGISVLGLDASEAAISLCKAKAEHHGASSSQFKCLSADDDAVAQTIQAWSSDHSDHFAIYARFFLHAIPEEVELKLLETVSKVIGDGIFAVEFRTARDASQTKVTPDHYRRFIDPLHFINRASTKSLHATYFTEGFGLAKYGNDDAHVARVVLRSSK